MPTDNQLFIEGAEKALAASKAVRVATWREQKPLERERLWQLLRRMPPIKWPICTLVAAVLVPLGYVFPVLQSAYLVLGALVMFDFIRIGRWLEKTSPGTEEMLDLPTPGAQYTVRVLLSHQGTTYGEDSGVISVMEGGLHFSGRCTDFSLTRLTSRLRKSKGVPPVFVVDFGLTVLWATWALCRSRTNIWGGRTSEGCWRTWKFGARRLSARTGGTRWLRRSRLSRRWSADSWRRP
jgi:hypothetical protein